MRYPFLLATAFPLAAALAGCRDHPGTATPSRLPGVCAEIAAVPLESLNRVLLPATYAFQLRRPASIDIEMVSGGGGGGGSSDHNLGWAKPGEGGGAGGYLFKTFRFNAGFYFVKVGGSGARGMSVPPGGHATSGGNGGESILGYCSSGKPIAALPGGKGGAADAHDGGRQDFGGDGASLVNPTTGVVIGTGGSGRQWMVNGDDASGYGSGGGGSGGTRTPDRVGGAGAPGFAKIARAG